MKIVSILARILLGLMFVVFGLNGFLHFIPMGPTPTGSAGQFLGALQESHYLLVVMSLEIIGGALLLLNLYVPLALTLLAPVIFNILLFHAFMAPLGMPLALVTIIFWLVVAYQVRSVFAGLLQRRTA